MAETNKNIRGSFDGGRNDGVIDETGDEVIDVEIVMEVNPVGTGMVNTGLVDGMERTEPGKVDTTTREG